VIRIDAGWMAVEPLDMRSGTEAAFAQVVNVLVDLGFEDAEDLTAKATLAVTLHEVTACAST